MTCGLDKMIKFFTMKENT